MGDTIVPLLLLGHSMLEGCRGEVRHFKTNAGLLEGLLYILGNDRKKKDFIYPIISCRANHNSLFLF